MCNGGVLIYQMHSTISMLFIHDITRNIWLIENGWRVMRFWNFEVKDEMERCISDFKALIAK